AAGAPGVRAPAGAGDPVLRRAPPGQTRHDRPGPGPVTPGHRLDQRPAEAGLRPVLRPPHRVVDGRPHPAGHGLQAAHPALPRPAAARRPARAGGGGEGIPGAAAGANGRFGARAYGVSPGGRGMGFFFFLLVTATLLVRPADHFQELRGVRLYEALILVCFACSFGAVLEQFTLKSLETRPVTVCVLGLLAAIVVSHLGRGKLGSAAEDGFDFFKLLVYYVLLVANVTTTGRLKALM